LKFCRFRKLRMGDMRTSCNSMASFCNTRHTAIVRDEGISHRRVHYTHKSVIVDSVALSESIRSEWHFIYYSAEPSLIDADNGVVVRPRESLAR
jgi:hypothetical protein